MAPGLKHPLIRKVLPQRLETKFIVTAVISILFVGIVIGIAFYQYEKKRILTFAENEALDICKTIGIVFTNVFISEYLDNINDDEYFESTINELVRTHQSVINAIQVYDKYGHLLASSFLSDFSDSAARVIPTVEEFTPRIDPISSEVLKITLPLHSAAKTWGYLRMRFNMTSHLMLVRTLYVKIIAGVLVFVMVSAGFSALVARKLARPIKELSSTMSDITPGRFQHQLKVDRNDEIGRLQERFIHLIERLKQAAEKEKRMFSKMVQAEKLAAVGALTAGVAHEINNPITGMESCLSHLKRRLEGDQATVRYIDPIVHALEHIKNVVRHLLDYSGKRTYSFQETKLNDVIEQALKMASYRIKKQNISVNVSAPNPSITGQWDPAALEQVFLNIFLNALDAMKDKGTLKISSYLKNSRAVIEVADTGSGIPGDVRDKIFDPFFSTKSREMGTGLGLAVSLKIIGEHMGAIELVSSSGTGTIFAIYLPALVSKKKERK